MIGTQQTSLIYMEKLEILHIVYQHYIIHAVGNVVAAMRLKW